MDTVVGIAPAHTLVRITTNRATEFIDITDRIQSLVHACGVSVGILNLQALHTTTALVVNEHEPLLLSERCSTRRRPTARVIATTMSPFGR
jgi:thiamine phosphate synthase YjbQ (UPF0047 family)